MKRRQTEAGFLSPRSSKIILTKEKEREKKERARRKKGGEEKKANVAALSFYNGFLGDRFWPKKLLDAKIKNLFVLSVRISSYGCTQEVRRARKMRKSCTRR